MSDCTHPKLQLQQILPTDCLVPGDGNSWYNCELCGSEFSTELKKLRGEIVVSQGVDEEAARATETHA